MSSSNETTALWTAAVLTLAGILASSLDVTDSTYYHILVPGAAILLTAGLLSGVLSWKLHVRTLGKTGAGFIIFICVMSLPDILFRRLPSTLTDPHLNEKQKLLTGAVQARMKDDYPELERIYKEIIHGESSGRFRMNRNDSAELGLADVLEREGKFAAAEQSYRQALEQARFAWGASDQHLVPILEGLARTLEAQDKSVESRDFYKLALSINEKNWQMDKQASPYYEAVSKRISAKLPFEDGVKK